MDNLRGEWCDHWKIIVEVFGRRCRRAANNVRHDTKGDKKSYQCDYESPDLSPFGPRSLLASRAITPLRRRSARLSGHMSPRSCTSNGLYRKHRPCCSPPPIHAGHLLPAPVRLLNPTVARSKMAPSGQLLPHPVQAPPFEPSWSWRQEPHPSPSMRWGCPDSDADHADPELPATTVNGRLAQGQLRDNGRRPSSAASKPRVQPDDAPNLDRSVSEPRRR
jgi:hypothetical protein